ncbi:hypothetical protein JRQ81_010522 [Phrynocephalus forsythii]|uniref:Uncharacterized protein n=1 Tax=Phrynocephalus forsythii TaxID=171643 RepID=A0A9Q0Y026_9SAUR|nr:hypothetical protein JRQ81_010522 [Phrynocephalus forsythii]
MKSESTLQDVFHKQKLENSCRSLQSPFPSTHGSLDPKPCPARNKPFPSPSSGDTIELGPAYHLSSSNAFITNVDKKQPMVVLLHERDDSLPHGYYVTKASSSEPGLPMFSTHHMKNILPPHRVSYSTSAGTWLSFLEALHMPFDLRQNKLIGVLASQKTPASTVLNPIPLWEGGTNSMTPFLANTSQFSLESGASSIEDSFPIATKEDCSQTDGISNWLLYLYTIANELGLHLPSTFAWTVTIKFWLRIHFHPDSNSLVYELLRDPYVSKWYQFIQSKIHRIGIDLDSLINCQESQILKIIHQRIWDIEYQTISSGLNPTCSPHFYGLMPTPGLGANYMKHLINPCLCRAFMLARLNILPSAVLSGRYYNVPFEKRLCKLCLLEPDSTSHILLSCPSHHKLRLRLLTPYISNFSGSPESITKRLLEDKLPELTASVAEYLATVLHISK